MADEVVYHHAPKTEEHSHTTTTDAVKAEPAEVEATDRGLFGIFGKKDEEKKCDEGAISSEFEGKVHISEPKPKTEEKHEEKKESLLEKLRRSDSSSGSSSSDEECADGEKKKKKKGLKEKVKGKVEEHKEKKEEEKIEHDTTVPIEKCDEVAAPHPTYDHGPPAPASEVVHPIEPTPEPEEKKGLMEKIKEKLPGGHKKAEEEHPAPPPPPPAVVHDAEGEHKEKKGIFEKIKEKIPGYHGKSEEEKKEVKKEKECD